GLDLGGVLLDRDLALAYQELAEAVVGQVAGGADHAPVLDVEGLARPARDQGEDAGGAGDAEVLEDVGDGQLRDLALEAPGHEEGLNTLGDGGRHGDSAF